MNYDEFCRKLSEAKSHAQKKLDKCRKEKENTVLYFSLAPVLSTSEEFGRVADKCKLFFNLFANSTVEIIDIQKVICPDNEIKFWERALCFESLPTHVELYRSESILKKEISSINDLYNILMEKTGGQMFELFKYAKPDSVGRCTFVVCDVMLGELQMSEDDEQSTAGPLSYWVRHVSQIMIKYAVNLVAKKVAAAVAPQASYHDVPEFLMSQNDGVLMIDLKTFNLRDASSVYHDLVLKASAMYNGDCLRRKNYYGKHKNYKNPEIKRIGIVVCHNIWKSYEERRKTLEENFGTEIYGYHATPPTNVDSIVANNLDWRRHAAHGRAYGDGCYFSEYPEFSFRYNQHCMFIFKVMLFPNQYSRHKASTQGFCEQIIVKDPSMFKPVYVLYFY